MISRIKLPIQSVIYLTESGLHADCTTMTLGDKLSKCESGGYTPIAILETTDHDALLCASMLFTQALMEKDPYSKLERKARFAEYMEELDRKGISLTVACPDASRPIPDSWSSALSVNNLIRDAVPVDTGGVDYKEVFKGLGFSDEDIAHLEAAMGQGLPSPLEDLRRLLEDDDDPVF
jgi:hypothetical protein